MESVKEIARAACAQAATPRPPQNSGDWIDAARQVIAARVPKAYRAARLKDFPAPIADPLLLSHGICLRGGTGIGKTHLATALLIAGMDPAHPRTSAEQDRNTGRLSWDICWIDAPGLLCRIRSSFRDNARESEMEIIDRLTSCSWLLLDDLGAEKQTDWSAATLYAIVARRRNAERITLVTTNQSLEEIAAWEPRLASRLAEMGTVRLPDRDRRIK